MNKIVDQDPSHESSKGGDGQCTGRARAVRRGSTGRGLRVVEEASRSEKSALT